jgi:hypothetical protein
MMEFKEFPKMARLSREIIITEKIDGTNSSIFIQNAVLEEDGTDPSIIAFAEPVDGLPAMTLRVGSRTKWITPETDNHGFANWVAKNLVELFKLGEGHHFGEWWGSGIQRGYGLEKGEKRFSLFNVARWGNEGTDKRPDCCSVVPTLYKGPFDTIEIDKVLANLAQHGSYASPGFMKPEGIVVFHTAGNLGFKKTIEKDELPKSLVKQNI